MNSVFAGSEAWFARWCNNHVLTLAHVVRQNHPDGQIFTPPYLLNADGSPAARPVVIAAPTTAHPGATIAVTTNVICTAFSIIRVRP